MANRQTLAFQACIGRSLNRADHHSVQEPIGEDYEIEDLPIKHIDSMGKTPSLTAFIEIHRHIEPLDNADNAAASTNTLASPWGYASTKLPPHEVQIYTKPCDGGLDVVKLVQFTNRCYVPLIKASCTGEVFGLSKAKGQAIRLLQPAVHYIGCRLGGIVTSNQSLDAPTKPVLECGRHPGRIWLHQIQWSHRLWPKSERGMDGESERNRPESPIFGWLSWSHEGESGESDVRGSAWEWILWNDPLVIWPVMFVAFWFWTHVQQ